MGPSDISSEICMTITAKDCKGRDCGPMPPFDIIHIQGQGLIVHYDNIPPSESIPGVRVHSNSVPAQWVTLIQPSLLTRSRDEQQSQNNSRPMMTSNILQDRQCLHCFLMSAVQGLRS